MPARQLHRPAAWTGFGIVVATAVGASACQAPPLDEQLRSALDSSDVTPVSWGRSQDADLVRLGQALFFDKELSGNRDIACATCHHPSGRTSDNLSLSIGTGGSGLGRSRTLGEGRQHLPRNAAELFNRGAKGWKTAYWDGRVAGVGGVSTAVGAPILPPSANVLATTITLEVVDRAAMRGVAGDLDVEGEHNTLSYWTGDQWQEIWAELMERLLDIGGYVGLFEDAYPEVARNSLTFGHAAAAIAAYIVDAYTLRDSPWDRYVDGDDNALIDSAKRGALLFFGDARCGECHSGPLLTDQAFHNVCVPQVGPGVGISAPEDTGRALVTGLDGHRYAFRTPPLRNVSFTGPYMHNGSITTLEGAVRHHFDPCEELRLWDASQLDPQFREGVIERGAYLGSMTATLDPMFSEPMDLGPDEIIDLMAFLEALSDPATVYMSGFVPPTVPSGLPVDG